MLFQADDPDGKLVELSVILANDRLKKLALSDPPLSVVIVLSANPDQRVTFFLGDIQGFHNVSYTFVVSNFSSMTIDKFKHSCTCEMTKRICSTPSYDYQLKIPLHISVLLKIQLIKPNLAENNTSHHSWYQIKHGKVIKRRENKLLFSQYACYV